jgi:hypothetical protein
MPIELGTPTTSAITTSGRMAALTSRVEAIPAINPTAPPTSIALVSAHARGSGITLPTITPRHQAKLRATRRDAEDGES